MNITEYIKLLEQLRSEHGDLEVRKYMPDGSMILAGAHIRKDNMRINNNRQSKEACYFHLMDKPDQKGRPICRRSPETRQDTMTKLKRVTKEELHRAEEYIEKLRKRADKNGQRMTEWHLNSAGVCISNSIKHLGKKSVKS